MLIIIMYIYHALINALSAHMIHINLNMIFYTHVKHSPTTTKCYTHSVTKKYESRDVRIHAYLPIIYPDTVTDTEREKRGSREVPIHVQSVTT